MIPDGDTVVIGIDVAVSVIVAIADATAMISSASAWEIQVPSVSITITCIGIEKYAAASTVFRYDLPGVSQKDPSSVSLFVSSKMHLLLVF